MKYTSPIDPHVHLRWTEYADHEFTRWAYLDAQAVGLAAFMEMPNTTPALTDALAFTNRLVGLGPTMSGVARETGKPLPQYHAHIGLTGTVSEVVDALRWARDEEISAKMFCCHSTGNMGLLDESQRENVWRVAAEVGYEEAIVVHAEDHTCFGLDPEGLDFDPADPLSHALYRNETAESVAALEQVRHARKHGFLGTIVFAHTSSPDMVEMVRNELRPTDTFAVKFEVTWHHLFLNIEDDYPLHGNRVKMNPPLRSKRSQERLWDMLFDGRVDFIGTDHAPHPVARKDDPEAPASGIPAIPFWPKGIELLRQDGMNEALLRRVTFANAATTFGLEVQPFEVETEYDPSRWEKYGWNPFSRWG